jgi:hypothetical protein
MGFKNLQILPQNPKVLAFCFREKKHIAAKTDQKSIFLDRETYILDR